MNAGMTGAVALVGIGLITIGLSNFSHRADASPVAQPPTGGIVGVVLDPSSASGRWSSRLLAVQGDGKILELDTTLPQSRWKPFQYSP